MGFTKIKGATDNLNCAPSSLQLRGNSYTGVPLSPFEKSFVLLRFRPSPFGHCPAFPQGSQERALWTLDWGLVWIRGSSVGVKHARLISRWKRCATTSTQDTNSALRTAPRCRLFGSTYVMLIKSAQRKRPI